MIRDDVFSFAFFKKGIFNGSYQGMQYRIAKADELLEAYAYPQPFALEYTEENLVIKSTFEYSPEGRKQAIEWLEKVYEEGSWPVGLT